MGSFNVGCGLSNLSIGYGNRVGFVFLDENHYLKYERQLSSTSKPVGKTCHVYSTDNYAPCYPPVFGTYDDYGFVKNVDNNLTKLILEKEFGQHIETIIKCVSSNRSVYDSYGPIFDAYLPKESVLGELKGSLSKIARGSDADNVLEALGFEISDADGACWYSNEEFILVKDSKNHWSIRDHGTNRTLIANKFVREISDLLELFGEVTGTYPGFDRKHFASLTKLRNMSGMYFLEEVFEKMNEFSLENSYSVSVRRDRPSFVNSWDSFQEELRTPSEGKWLSRNYNEDVTRFFNEKTNIRESDYESLLAHYEGESLKEITDLYDLVSLTTVLNRMFAPSYAGEQLPDNDVMLELLKVSTKITEERTEDY